MTSSPQLTAVESPADYERARELDGLLELSRNHRVELLFGGRLQYGDEFRGMRNQPSLAIHTQFGIGDWHTGRLPWAYTFDGAYSSSEGSSFFGDQARLDTFDFYVGVSRRWKSGRHQWSLNPAIGVVVFALDSSDRVENSTEAQMSGQVALRYRYQVGQHMTWGVHLSQQLSGMVRFGRKKVQLASTGLYGSIGLHFESRHVPSTFYNSHAISHRTPVTKLAQVTRNDSSLL